MRFLAKYSSCWLPNKCNSVICNRQTASLKALASHTVFKFVSDFDIFELSSQYIYAVESDQLVPTDHSEVTATYNTHPPTLPNRRYHRVPHYHIERPWYSKVQQHFHLQDDFTSETADNKYDWWCAYCDKPNFGMSLYERPDFFEPPFYCSTRRKSVGCRNRLALTASYRCPKRQIPPPPPRPAFPPICYCGYLLDTETGVRQQK